MELAFVHGKKMRLKGKAVKGGVIVLVYAEDVSYHP
jgi:hypothetical protein